MDLDSELNDFAETFSQDVINQAQLDATFIEDKFVEQFAEYLIESGEIDDITICYHKSRGIKVNGYSINNEENRLDLFVAIYRGTNPPEKISKTEVDVVFKWIVNYLKKSLEGYHFSLEESSPHFDMSLNIYSMRGVLRTVRFFLITDGIANLDSSDNLDDGTLIITKHLWDIRRLHRLRSSGNRREPIEIDFIQDCGSSVPCLPISKPNSVYTSYLALIPGKTLFEIYRKYGSRLLERNVRAFLQVKGNVNKGIRKTILEEPHMFLAYNNGLSATAESVELDTSGTPTITRVKDFQIVNGGQTTASIYNACIKDKADVSEIIVPMKLTVLKNPEMIDSFVPKISAFANSQNKINIADFSSNNPFHVKLEELSRTIWAPVQKGMNLQTRWYYERARGQYLDEKGRQRTAADKKTFESIYPSSQKFTKTDMAKFENTWNLLPHIVSRGAEKNFNEFMGTLNKIKDFVPDKQYYEDLISKAILFKRAEKIIHSQQYGGYRANIVTYTLALIYYKTNNRINLNRIWKEQDISEAMSNAIVLFSKEVHKHITNPPDGKNITEWCKKEQCWTKLLDSTIDLPVELIAELVEKGPNAYVQLGEQTAADLEDDEL
ncbi:AIPR family protein [Methanocella arvoryzae]|uniref:Abortive infection phage resistance protein n=1 Tax=Methanocella arvoryzae (strain DSM 22066 / NBRC 105507 / MRE50) TaxID=351160 RepID=Q0W1Z5_METAR|nr:AIPR family protein [Methanocella arvoryzae]CAJ37598.1 conserved hypothetical protein [Methanocella arvoryzae MRE50]